MTRRYYAHKVAAAALAMSRLASAQNPGTNTPEVHPTLPTWKCTTSGGCIQQNTAVVLDWNYRWIHTANGSTSCVNNGQVDSSLCPSEATCSQNCVVEGANYTSSGVSTSGDALTMYQYVKGSTGSYQNASPRLYLLDSNTGNYVDFKLLGQELTFTVDLSTLPCGENGALYLSQMDTTGGRNQYQTGGANYGSGYCDAQCPVQAWKNGTLNTNGGGFCCNEMDILESNSQASAFTPHPCSGGSCDSGGCGFNPYSQGYHNYWGPGMTVDTSKPVTITTQFITNDGTSTGTLAQIKRIYSQNGKALASAVSGGDIITSSWCNTVDSSAASHGGLAQMGQALGQGMVLAFSIWNDNSQYMNWLDSGNSGPCSSSAGNPSTIVSQNPTTHVIFSNIRWGDIGSTTDGTASGGNGSSSSSSSTTTTTDATVPPAATATQTHWGQCGGSYFTGPTVCQAPYTCQTQNPYYAQCL